MNKKIIAIAIAAAMAAPVMADVTVGGQIGAALVSGSEGYVSQTAKGTGFVANDSGESYMGMMDAGLSKVEFSGSAGDASFKIGLDVRTVMGGSAASIAGRDFWLGHKLGTGTLSFGRMPAALAGLEGDKYNATFLEMRRTAAVSTTDNSSTDTYFADPVIQYAVKAGGATIKAQYQPTTNTGAGYEGYFALAVKGNAGPVAYYAGVNNGRGTKSGAVAATVTPATATTNTVVAAKAAADHSDQNIKVGGSMKFGAAKVGLMVMKSDNDGATGTSTAITADMAVSGATSVGLGYGVQTGNVNKDDTWMRLAVTHNLSKATRIFGGYVAQHDESAATNKDTNALGVGMAIKF